MAASEVPPLWSEGQIQSQAAGGGGPSRSAGVWSFLRVCISVPTREEQKRWGDLARKGVTCGPDQEPEASAAARNPRMEERGVVPVPRGATPPATLVSVMRMTLHTYCNRTKPISLSRILFVVLEPSLGRGQREGESILGRLRTQYGAQQGARPHDLGS